MLTVEAWPIQSGLTTLARVALMGSIGASQCAGVGALAVIAFWRFILGFGIGGDYPLSATITSEYANTRWRGAFIASVFAGQVRAPVRVGCQVWGQGKGTALIHPRIWA